MKAKIKKVWAITWKGELVAIQETSGIQFQVYLGIDGKPYFSDKKGFAIVPATITYQLPNPKKKR